MKRLLSGKDVLASLAALQLEHRWHQVVTEAARLSPGAGDAELASLVTRLVPDRDMPALRLLAVRRSWAWDDTMVRIVCAVALPALCVAVIVAAKVTGRAAGGAGEFWLLLIGNAVLGTIGGWGLGRYVARLLRWRMIMFASAERTRALLRAGMLTLAREHRARATSALDADLRRLIEERRP